MVVRDLWVGLWRNSQKAWRNPFHGRIPHQNDKQQPACGSKFDVLAAESALWAWILKSLFQAGILKNGGAAKAIRAPPVFFQPARLSPMIHSIRSAFPVLSSKFATAQPVRLSYAYSGILVRPHGAGTGMRRSFFNHATRPQFNAHHRPTFGARRNFSTSPFATNPQATTNLFGTFMANGGKVFAAAATEKTCVAYDENKNDDLKARLSARAGSRKTDAKKDSRRVRLDRVRAKAQTKKAPVVAKSVKSQEKEAQKPKMSAPVQTAPAFGANDHVRMSIYLYAPPSWELESLRQNPRCALHPAAIAELRRIANIHYTHLLAVSNILESLMGQGVTNVEVREEEGGLMEIGVHFKNGASLERVQEWLKEIGIGEGSEMEEGHGHFSLEVVKGEAVEESVEEVVEKSIAERDLKKERGEIEEFLAMVNTLIKEDRSFGSQSL
ncbi:hypothetical protein HDV00_003546 [Rhizophlyctis rosea]|nr:hypothetical protein HDV00_003546 [Rhizophlyctis rosea]